MPPTLRSLAAFKDRVLLCGGLADEPANRVRGGGDHARSAGTFLTGVPFKLTSGADVYGSVSMDQIAAKQLAKETQLGVARARHRVERDARLVRRRRELRLHQHHRLEQRRRRRCRSRTTRARCSSGSFGTSGSTDRGARLARIEQDRSILDFVNEQTRRAPQAASGRPTRLRVTEYLDRFETSSGGFRWPSSRIRASCRWSISRSAIPADYAEHAKLMMDMLALAYQTDLTRVSTFMLAKEVSGRSYPEIGVADSHHPVSHHQDEPAKLERLHKINEYHFRQFAYLVDKLSKLPEGDGTMLDHTLFMYGTGISDSNTHFHDDLPIALVGGKAAGIKGGRYIRYAKGTPLTNLYLTCWKTWA